MTIRKKFIIYFSYRLFFCTFAICKTKTNHHREICSSDLQTNTLSWGCYLLSGSLCSINTVLSTVTVAFKINQLENEQKYYREKIEEDKRKKEELLGNRDNLEKFAREQYLMKKENEDIFIIVKE